MAIEIWDGQWRNSSDPEIYTNTGWKDIMEGHAYIGNSVWNRFFIRITPVAPTLGNVSRTNSSLTFSYSHPGDSSGVYLVLKLVRVSDNAVIAGPENTSLTSGAISGNKTYTGLAQGVSYRFEAYAVYNSYSINSTVATTTYSTLSFSPVTPTLSLNSSTVSSITVRAQLTTSSSPYNARIVIWNDDTQSAIQASRLPANGQVGTIDVLFSSSSLSVNTSYRFAAYTEYRDPSTLEVIANSDIVYQQFSTLAYLVTTPTQPYNTDRQRFSLKFKASSNANYSRNGSSYTANAYIEFNLYRTSNNVFVSAQTAALPNNDTLTELEVEFTGLSSGVSYYCRARTYYYSPVSQYSSYTTDSAAVSTLQLTTVSTGLINASNTTYFTYNSVNASSTSLGFPVSNISNGIGYSPTTNTAPYSWISDPGYPNTAATSIPVDQISRTPKVVRYSTSSSSGIPSFRTATSVRIDAPSGVFLSQSASTASIFQAPYGRAATLIDSSTQFCFIEGSNVRVSSSTGPPAFAANIPGFKTLRANNGTSITVPIPSTLPAPQPNVVHGTTTRGPRPGLTGTYPVSSFTTSPSGTVIEVNTGNVPSTPTFSTATVGDTVATPGANEQPAPVRMFITGIRNKSSIDPAAGETYAGAQYPEEVVIYVVLKADYVNPRMVSGTDTIKVHTPSGFSSNISLSAKTNNSAGNLINQGSGTISSSGGTHTFNLITTAFAMNDPFFNLPAFKIVIGGNRVFRSDLDGVAIAIIEVEFSFSYDTYS